MAKQFSMDDYVDVAERIAARTVPAANGCLEWRGAVGSHGYGSLSIRNRLTLTHRAIYEARVRRIPAGHQIDHLCRNRRCVNPTHLEAVTQRVNVRRGIGRPPEEVQFIRESPLSGAELARMFNTSRGAISNIRTGKRHG